ncbi:MAG: DUF4159 domain-containing protein [bacterium]|nr:DUF4159 domain-containing protein [bacterium]
MVRKTVCLLIILVIISFMISEKPVTLQSIKIPRLKYSGGGDWYNGKTEIPNLLKYFQEQTGISAEPEDFFIEPDDSRIFNYPFIFVTGHGNISFNEIEIKNLRSYLLTGGFLYVDDDYGLDKPFRRELERIFPEFELVELDKNHIIFNCYFKFPDGLPKIHKHDGKPPQAFGLFDDKGRMMVFYTYETNISDGWDSPGVHNNPEDLRETALKMGVNIIMYALTH